MQDEKIDQEQKSAPTHHELSETPFGVGNPQPEAGADSPETTAEAVETETAASSNGSEVEEPMSMEQALAMSGAGVDYSGTFKTLTEGDVVDGVVVHIDREGVLVDVGTKSEGTIKPGELARDQSLAPEEVVSVGEKIRVYVVQADSQDGGPILSKKRADFENAWDRVEKAFETKEMLKAMVTDRVKGGLVVDLGIRGFVPASHVGSGKLKNLEKFVGQSMPFKVIEVDRERRKVVLSNREAADEERSKQRDETLGSLAEGQIREGVVRRLTDYGAFVDLGGVDGLLHISEMSWTRINHPSEVVKVGQKLQVMVLKLNLREGRVSLGLRQILPDPWEDIKRIHQVGEVIKGTVSRLVPFGAFVQVEGGVEGIIPNSELAVRRVNKPEDVVSVGQEVEVKVIDLRAEERRMTLSLRQLQVQKERDRDEAEYRSYSQSRSSGVETKTTIGDLFGEQLGGLSSAAGEAEKPKAPKAKRTSRAKAARMEAIEEAEALEEAEAIAEVEEMMMTDETEVQPAAEAEAEAEVEAPAAQETAEEEVAVEEETPAETAAEQEAVVETGSAGEPAAEAEAAEEESEAEASAEEESEKQ